MRGDRYILAALCVVDTAVTLWLWKKGLIKEENIIMRWFLERSESMFILVKAMQFTLAAIVGDIIWTSTPRLKVLYWLLVGLYAGVFLRVAFQWWIG